MAKKQRFRDTKQKRVTDTSTINQVEKPTIPFAGNGIKAKAFLTDVFMLFMPILYIVIYVVMDGREGVSAEMLKTWIYVFTPFLLILTLFMYKDEGRTPGSRAQGLKVIEFHTLAKPSLFSIVFRNLTLVLTMIVPLFWLIPFFRKDGRSLHDLLSATCVIKDPKAPKNLVFKPKSD